LKLDYHILVIDDNSPDGTAEIIKRFLPIPGSCFERRTGKQGLGTAYIYGFRWAVEKAIVSF
jgi:dolichol-phosphate mannosyltransferase